MPGANSIRNVGSFCEAKRFFVDYLGVHAQVIEQLYGIHRTSKPCRFRERKRAMYLVCMYTYIYIHIHMHMKMYTCM